MLAAVHVSVSKISNTKMDIGFTDIELIFAIVVAESPSQNILQVLKDLTRLHGKGDCRYAFHQVNSFKLTSSYKTH